MKKQVFDSSVRPKHQQSIIYYFEPFSSWFCGQYCAETDSAYCRGGFTTWLPEVLMWMANDSEVM